MEQRRIDIARLGLLAGLLLLITVVLYIPSFHGGFVWDDAMYITGNPIIKAPDGLHRFWFTTEAFDYYPLTWTLWWIEWRAWGEHTFGYHVVSVLLHAVNALLLWLILRRLRIPGAWFAALLFAVHPVNVATVAWISEQKNTLSMFFCALTIFFYLNYEHEHRRLWYVLSLLTFTLALLSKSAVVMLPVALLGCIWWRRRNVRSNDLWHCAPFFVLSLILGIVTIWFQYTRVLRGHSVRSDSFFSRLLGAGSAVWFYVYKTLLPFKLSLLYPKSPADPAVPGSYVPFLALLLFFGIVWWKRKTWGRGLLFGFGYFVIMLLPVLGFIDQNFYQYSLVADHWQYYSMIGIIALLVAGAISLFGRMGDAGRYAELLLGAVIVLALGTATWARIPVYADSEALWRDAVLKNPQAWAAHNNLGNVLMQAGRLDDARQQYEQALHIEPFLAEPHNNLGTIFVQEGKLQDAIVQYEEALEVKLDFAEAQNNLGAALLRAGSLDEAIPHIAAAVQLNPNYDEARYNLAVLLASRGRVDEAIAQMQTAVRQEPGRVEFQQKLNELEQLKSAH